jgi:HPt (histidine-containing phosphotransfer) domain-containing protein
LWNWSISHVVAALPDDMDQHTLAAKVHELAAGDTAVAREFIRILIDTNHTTLVTLRESLRTGAWREATSAAHRINGSARLIGFEALVERTLQLEAAAAAQDAPRAAMLFSSVEGDVERVEAWLANLADVDGSND